VRKKTSETSAEQNLLGEFSAPQASADKKRVQEDKKIESVCSKKTKNSMYKKVNRL
jgi:hypothetical protein